MVYAHVIKLVTQIVSQSQLQDVSITQLTDHITKFADATPYLLYLHKNINLMNRSFQLAE